MEAIILIGHGSPKKDANNMQRVAELVHARLHPGCIKGCVRWAYLQYAEPDVSSAIESAIQDGADSIVLHPYFLNSGVHVTKDIPGIIEGFRASHPRIRFAYTEPLGLSELLADLVIRRVAEAKGIAPGKIEDKSMEILSEEADLSAYPNELHPIVKRVIHSTADFEFQSLMRFHPSALENGIRAIRDGKDILVDVKMIEAGINKKALMKFKGRVICHIPDEEPGDGRTKAECGIEEGLRKGNIGIVAIGNAPTALYKSIDMIKSGNASAELIVGVSVGFVRALESKEALIASGIPYITAIGRKGGSTVAVAIINALIKIAGGNNE